MNIAFAINHQYLPQLRVVVASLIRVCGGGQGGLHIFILSSDVSDGDLNEVRRMGRLCPGFAVECISVDAKHFDSAPHTIDYLSKEAYYRFLLPEHLPEIDRVLYLDADLLVLRDLDEFYNQELGDALVAAVADRWLTEKGYPKSLGLSEYANSGVILFDLQRMRNEKTTDALLRVLAEKRNTIKFQDQDVLNITLAGRIKFCEWKYNCTSQDAKRLGRKAKAAHIRHFTGPNKPWLSCHDVLWRGFTEYADKLMRRKIRVGLLIDEFFGGAGTPYGGYGFLARRYIARYLPNESIEIDVLLGKGKRRFWPTRHEVDDVVLWGLPRNRWAASRWLSRQNYDMFLSIELVDDYVLKRCRDKNMRLLLWIQDPRPKESWVNTIGTMKSISDPCFYNQRIYDFVHVLNDAGRVRFITQGRSLNPLARLLYRLPEETAIDYVPNPIEQDMGFRFDLTQKKKQVIFLERLEAQKRCWLFCEIAKRMPEYEFLVCGGFFRHKEENQRMMMNYMNDSIPNLKFMGHIEGAQKEKVLRESRLLVSTAIWEGIPISWLEALSYGLVIVSDLERDDLISRFGTFVGEVSGDGFDGVDRFIPAIRHLMEDDAAYVDKAARAIEYVRDNHGIEQFVKRMRQKIREEAWEHVRESV